MGHIPQVSNMKPTIPALSFLAAVLLAASPQPSAAQARVTLVIDSRMPSPRWAEQERRLLDDNLSACREFCKKYFDERG
jgi:hypothetical protein